MPKEIQVEIKKQKDLQKTLQLKMQRGITPLQNINLEHHNGITPLHRAAQNGNLEVFELQKEFKKQNDYCNNLIKKFVREKEAKILQTKVI